MSNISLVKLGKYTTPEIKENKREKYVAYGDDNNYYATLLESKQSPTNSALINGISDMIYGRGLYATDAAKKPDEYAMMVQLFTEDLMRKICDDFYTLGQASFQVIYDTAHTKIMEVAHMPIQNLRPEKMNEEGDIEAYYYCDDWANAKTNDKHERIPVFGSSNEGLEVFVIKPYKAGFHYFSPVEYQSGLDYAFVEIELAKFHLNNIFNKFSANMIINFNNGVPEEDQQRIIEGKIKDKFTGTEGDSVIVAFNDNKENAASIESVNLPDAHNQYQFIAEEASRKIMVSHRVVSPLLFGLPQNGGLGSNADEIKMAATLFDNTVIKPMQRLIIEAVNSILAFNDVSLNVFMLTSQPLDFTEMEVESVDDTTAQETSGVETGIATIDTSKSQEVQDELIQKEASYNGAQISSALQIMQAVSEGTLTKDQAVTFLIQMLQFDPSVANALFSGNAGAIITQMMSQKKSEGMICCSSDKNDNLDNSADELIAMGEDENLDEWDLISSNPVDYINDQDIKQDQSLLSKAWNFVSTGTAKPNQKSEQDTGLFKVRYQYAPLTTSANSRDFCRKMVSAGKIYRKEDIIAMDNKAVNAGWGPNGSNTYSIWFYKGGGDCHHYWMRKVYMRKRGSSGGFLPNDGLSNDKEVSVNEARKAGVPLQKNDAKVAKLPTDMPNNGFLKPRK